jgi:hypothetical protein
VVSSYDLGHLDFGTVTTAGIRLPNERDVGNLRWGGK